MMAIHCFYHSADLDGHCSGAIVKYKYPEAVMHPINYGDEFPWDEIGEEDEVYMVDFCLQPVEDMHKLCIHKADVVWIDHHSSAIRGMDEIGLVPKGSRDVTVAACRLTWEYLFPERPVPLAVKLLSLYDSWTYQGHELEDMVLPFQMRMRMEELDPKDWNEEGSIHSTPEPEKTWKFLFYPSASCDEFINQLVHEGDKSMKLCRSCKFWVKSYYSKSDSLRRCDSKKWKYGYTHRASDLLSDEILIEEDEGWGCLIGPDFGCVHHEIGANDESEPDQVLHQL